MRDISEKRTNSAKLAVMNIMMATVLIRIRMILNINEFIKVSLGCMTWKVNM